MRKVHYNTKRNFCIEEGFWIIQNVYNLQLKEGMESYEMLCNILDYTSVSVKRIVERSSSAFRQATSVHAHSFIRNQSNVLTCTVKLHLCRLLLKSSRYVERNLTLGQT